MVPVQVRVDGANALQCGENGVWRWLQGASGKISCRAGTRRRRSSASVTRVTTGPPQGTAGLPLMRDRQGVTGTGLGGDSCQADAQDLAYDTESAPVAKA